MNTIREMEMMWMNFRYGCLAIILVIVLAGMVSADSGDAGAMVNTVVKGSAVANAQAGASGAASVDANRAVQASVVPAGANTFVLNPAQGLPGDTVTIPIKMPNAVNLASADMKFDPGYYESCRQVFAITKIEKGSLTSGALFDWRYDSDSTAVFSFASSKAITGSGTIAIVTVKVLSTAGENGQKGCDFVVRGKGYDSNGLAIDLPVTGSTFSLAPAVKGDGDRDGKVTSSDALAALQMAVGKIPENLNYDMNGDQKVNSNDVREILKLSVIPVTISDVKGQMLGSKVAGINKASTAGNAEVGGVKKMQVAVVTTTPTINPGAALPPEARDAMRNSQPPEN